MANEYKWNVDGGVIRLADWATVPHDDENSDWRKFKQWFFAGGEPDAPDPWPPNDPQPFDPPLKRPDPVEPVPEPDPVDQPAE